MTHYAGPPPVGGQHGSQPEENTEMSKDRYTVDSDFDDLHGDPAEIDELEVDLSDADNPIIRAFVDGEADDDYVAPEDDDDGKKGKKAPKEDKFIDDDQDDDTLEELDDDDDDGEEEEEDDDEPAKKKKGKKKASDDDDDDGEEEEEELDEEEEWSRKVQKRIDRERDLRVSDNAESNRRFAKLERENKLFRAQTQYDKDQTDADSKLRRLRKDKAEAIEEGNTSKQVDLDDQILDIKSDRKVKQFELKQLEDSIDDDVDDTTGGRGTPPAGQRWLEKYPQFHTNKQFQNTVLQADKMVAGRGLDRNTDKYYEEIEKILQPQYPDIIKAVKVTKKPRRKAPKKRGRSAVGGTQRAGTQRTRKGVIRLTKTDQEQMEIFGMDPKDVKDVKAWADSKAGR